jgi:hypothetical protein
MAAKAQRTAALILARQVGKCGKHVCNIESEKERKHTPADFDGSETLVHGHTIQAVGNLFLLAFSSTACAGGQ